MSHTYRVTHLIEGQDTPVETKGGLTSWNEAWFVMGQIAKRFDGDFPEVETLEVFRDGLSIATYGLDTFIEPNF